MPASTWATVGESGDQLACTGCGTSGASFGGVSPAGWLGGMQFGYNWQGFGYSPLVVGIETDIEPSTILARAQTRTAILHTRGFRRLAPCAAVSAMRWIARSLFDRRSGLRLMSTMRPFSAGYVNNPNTVVTGYVLGGGIEYKIQARSVGEGGISIRRPREEPR